MLQEFAFGVKAVERAGGRTGGGEKGVGGSTRQLLDGIARHLLGMPPGTHVLPGHGPATTIGHEAASNPFLQ